MINFKILRRENIPCWYEISFDKKDKKLLFCINKDYLKHIEIKKDYFLIKKGLEEQNFENFASDFRYDLGFESCMKNEGERDNFRVFSVDIPQIKYFTDKNCSWCEGSGKDKLIDDKCLSCNGTGKEIEMRWREIIKIACTIEVLTKYLYRGIDKDKATSSKKNQLLSLSTMYDKGMQGGSLNGKISPCFAGWLETIGDESRFEEAIKNMKYAEHKMFGTNIEERFGILEIDAFVHGKNRLCISVPGDRTGIHPVDWYYEKGEGYEYSCHNVDSPAQQLELIIGLASICDKYREQKGKVN